MTQQVIDIGIQGNDGTGDSIRTSFNKVNQNFSELYAIFGAGGQLKFTNLSDAPAIKTFPITTIETVFNNNQGSVAAIFTGTINGKNLSITSGSVVGSIAVGQGLFGNNSIFLGSIVGNTLSVIGSPANPIEIGMVLTGDGIIDNIYIVSGAGATWTINKNYPIGETIITGTSVVSGTVITGGSGLSWTVNINQTVVSQSLNSTFANSAKLIFTNTEVLNDNIVHGAPFVVGQLITVTGLPVTALNGSHLVIDSTANSVTYSTSTQGFTTTDVSSLQAFVSDVVAYNKNQLLMSNTNGSAITARTILGQGGITINTNSNYDIVIKNTSQGLQGDLQPTLSNTINAKNTFSIANLPYPSQTIVDVFNNNNPGNPATIDSLAISKGYADTHYVQSLNGVILNPLNARSQPVVPPSPTAAGEFLIGSNYKITSVGSTDFTLIGATSNTVGLVFTASGIGSGTGTAIDANYDPTLTSNYLSTEVMQRKDTVYRGGDTMTGKLTLSDHPSPMAGDGKPKSGDDLQAATKFYVDNSTYYSGTNLFVSTTKGDDLQTYTPAGREGRAWQYAYKTIGAAAQQADTLMSLASTEPGPYRQTITWTNPLTGTQTKSTIQSAPVRSGGNTGNTPYEDAAFLLTANKAFIQYETIAYLNKKYVNTFIYDETLYRKIINAIIEGTAYDLVFSSLDGTNLTTYNSITQATNLFSVSNNNIIVNQLTQITDGINYALSQITNYTYNVINTQNYIGQVIDALCYDLITGSTYQTIQVGLAFASANTGLNSSEFVDLFDYSTNTITGIISNGTRVTFEFATQSSIPYAVNSYIVVSGTIPSSYNGVYQVTASTNASVTFISNVNSELVTGGIIAKNNVITNLLINTGVNSTSVTNNFKTNTKLLTDIINTGIAPEPSFPSLQSTTVGQNDAAQLLINNVGFIQAELVSFVIANYPNVSFNHTTCERDIKYVVWSLIYDLLYGGNSQTVYAALRYWFYQSTLQVEPASFWTNVYGYLINLTEAIISNTFIGGGNPVSPLNTLSVSGSAGIATINFASQTSVSFSPGQVIVVSGVVPGGYNGTYIVTNATTSSVSYVNSTTGIASVQGTVSGLPTTIYQQSVKQYTNETYSTGNSQSVVLTTNIKTFVRIIGSVGSSTPTPNTLIGSPSNITLGDNTTVSVVYPTTSVASFVGFISNTTLTALNVTGIVVVGQSLNGTSISAGTTISDITISIFQGSIVGNTLTVASNPSVPIKVGMVLTASGITDNIYIVSGLGNTWTINETYPISTSVITGTCYSVNITQSIGDSTHLVSMFTTDVLRNARLNVEAINNTSSSGNVQGLQLTGTNYVNSTFPIINNSNVINTLTTLFGKITSLLSNGLSSRTTPSYVRPLNNSIDFTDYIHAQNAILANLNFISAEALAYIKNTGNSSTYGYISTPTSDANVVSSVIYLLEAICYDITFTTNIASINAAGKYWINGINQLSAMGISTTAWDQILSQVSSITANVAQNTTVNPTNQSAVPQAQNAVWNTTNAGPGNAISRLFAIIKDIIDNNTQELYTTTSSTYVLILPSLSLIDPSLINTRNVIINNEYNISSSVLTYLSATYTGGFNYNESTCLRDLGYIVDAEIIDLLSNGNYQSINAGKSYYRNSSAKSIAIGTQLNQTLDGITFAKNLAIQVLNQTTAQRYQTGYTQTKNNSKNATGAVSTFITNYNYILNIIKNGYGSVSTSSITQGSGIYTISIDNGGNGYVDQGGNVTVGVQSQVHIIPGKILIGNVSGATAQVVSYTSGHDLGLSVDQITVRLTQPGFFIQGETLDFGETVSNLNITIQIESGIYYEDYPIKVPANVTIKGDDFRRTIVRPLNRISQSPWRNTFFYRDSVIDALQTGIINFSNDYAVSAGTTATISALTGSITISLGNNVQALQSWIGLVFMDATSETGTAGKAVINSISGSVLNASVIYPFAALRTYTIGSWHLYSTINYGYHYLSDPLNPNSQPKNNKDIDVFLVNDATRIKHITAQGHGGFMMVLDPTGQIKTKSPYAQESASFSASLGTSRRFAGGQFIDGFAGRLFGTVTNIANSGKTITVTGSFGSGLEARAPQVPCAFYVAGNRYQINDVSTYNPAATITTSTYISGGAQGTSTITVSTNLNIAVNQFISGTGISPSTHILAINGSTITLSTLLTTQAAGTYTFSAPQVILTLDNSTPFYLTGQYDTVASSNGLNSSGTFSNLLSYTIDNTALDMATYVTTTTTNSSINGSILTIGTVQSGTVQVGMYLTGANIVLGTYITGNINGSGNGSTWSLSYGYSSNIGPIPITGTLYSNYKTIIAGETFLQPQNSLSSIGQLLVQQGIVNAESLINLLSLSSANKTIVDNNLLLSASIASNGYSAVPNIIFPGINLASSVGQKAANIIQNNRTFIQSEIATWFSSTYNVQAIGGYNNLATQQDAGYIADAITYDILYGGNSSVIDRAASYYYNLPYNATSSNSANFLGYISGTTLNIVGSIFGYNGTNSGTVYVGQVITGLGVLPGTTIINSGGNGNTWIVNYSQSVGTSSSTVNMYSIQSVYLLSDPTKYAAAYAHLTTVLQQLIVNYTVTTSNGNQYSQNTSLPTAADSTFTGYITGTTLHVSTGSGMAANQILVGQGISANTYIVSGSGSTWTISPSQNVGSSGSPISIVSTSIGYTIKTLTDSLIGYVSSPTSFTLPNRIEPTVSSTDYATINSARSSLVTTTISTLNAGANIGINIEMGGNKSMLASDFTQVNDLGYGILCTNAALTEQVSTFTYYCYTAYWSLNGGQIRSVAGSNSNGTYGLRASGYDVTELPDSVNLAYDMVQTARVYKQGEFATAMTPTATTQSLNVYIIGYQYSPEDRSELEIDHTASGGGIVRYEVSTVSHTDVTIAGQNVLNITLSTSGNNATSTTGLAYALYDGQSLIIRVSQNFKFLNINNVKPVRPSTALQFNQKLSDIYRIVAYNLVFSTGEQLAVGTGQAVLTVDTGFNYYKLVSDTSSIGNADPINPIATASVVYNGVGNATNSYTLTVNLVTGNIVSGLVVGGIGFKGHTVQSVTTNTASITNGTISGGVFSWAGGGTYTGLFAIGMVLTGGSIPANTYIVSQNGATSWNINTTTVTQTSTTITGTNYAVTLSAYPTLAPIGPVYFSNRTQGAHVGDTRIAIVSITDQSEINQINSGTYILGWNGRTHRIISYTSGNSIAVGTYTSSLTVGSNTYTSGGTTLVLTSVSGSILANQIVTNGIGGSGFNGTQYVQSVQLIIVGSTVNAVVTLTSAPTTTPSGNLVFGASSNSYITIDSNPVYNNSSIGTAVSAMTYASQAYVPGSSTSKIITFTIPYNASANSSNTSILPPVDSSITVSGNATSSYNGTYQVVGINNFTTISTPSVSNLTIGMGVSSGSAGTVIPANTIIQSIDTINNVFVVAPACWVPAGAVITAQASATVLSLFPYQSIGSGYTVGVPPKVVLTDPGTAPTRAASIIATVNSDGTITLQIIDPGYGYFAAPTVSFAGGTGSVSILQTPVVTLTANPTTYATVTNGVINTSMQLLYPTDPGSSGTVTNVQFSGNQITTVLTSGPTLVPGNQIIFTGTAVGNILTTTSTVTTIYYILTNNSGVITISTSPNGSVFVPINTGSSSASMSFYSPSFAFGVSATVTGTPVKTGSSSPYSVTYSLSSSISITNGVYYRVTGNSNSLYNGYFPTTSATGTASTIVLSYPYDPGTPSSATTTTITKEVTSAVGGTLGISKPLSSTNTTTLRAGYPSGVFGQITVRISTARATGHDFLDIGTGGFDTTNYPNQIYGNPTIAADSSKQVLEEGVGRVFHVSTDENGIFKVGRFFSVDQGTGTVTFSASIALSNLDGLGFKRGVVVSEFSTDATMTENAPDIVPTQSATRQYVDLRLGLDYGGNPVAQSNLIGPGYLALNGTLAMKSNINMGNNGISNLTMPTTNKSPYDGVNRSYVDGAIGATNNLFKLQDVAIEAQATFVSQSAQNLKVTGITGQLLLGQTVSCFASASQGTISGFVFTAGGTVTGIFSIGMIITGNGISSGTVIVGSSSATSFTLNNSFNISTPIVIQGNYFQGQTILGIGVDTNNTANTILILSSSPTTQVQGSVIITFTSLANGNFLTYDTTAKQWKNIPLPTGDVNIYYNSASDVSGTLTTSIQSNKITNSMVNTTAGIVQSKLSMQAATTLSSAPGVFTQSSLGLSAFDSNKFTTSNGWVSLATSTSAITGVLYGNIQQMSANTVLGNLGTSAASPTEITPSAIVTAGGGVASANFTGAGVFTQTGQGTGYSITAVTTSHGSNSLIKSDSSGIVDISGIKVKGFLVITCTDNVTLQFATPSTGNSNNPIYFMTATGTTTSNTTITTSGILDTATNAGKIIVTDLKTNNSDPTVTANVTGTWLVQPNSFWDVTAGTLKSNSLTAVNSTNISPAKITGYWSIQSGSTFDTTAGTFNANSINGVNTTSGSPGSISGYWKLKTSSDILDTGAGKLISTSIATSTSGTSTAGTLTGSWTINGALTLGAGVTLTAPSTTTIDATAGTLKANALSTDLGSSTTGQFIGNWVVANGSTVTVTNAGFATNSTTATNATNVTTGGTVTTNSVTTSSIIANGGTQTIKTGTITGAWTLGANSSLNATYADLAEWYTSDAEYEPGTVLVFGGSAETTTTTQINDTRSAGIVTTDPAYTMNQDLLGTKVCIALVGRVPCKVIGRVKKGDMLTTSATPGYAVKALTPTLGAIIGKALEDKDYGEAGVMQVAVGRA